MQPTRISPGYRLGDIDLHLGLAERSWMSTGPGVAFGPLQSISPYTWCHQLVLLLIPFFTLCCQILAGRAPRWWLAPLAVGFVATNVHGLAWHHIPPGLLLSTPCYTTMMLSLMLAWLLLQEKRWRGLKQAPG